MQLYQTEYGLGMAGAAMPPWLTLDFLHDDKDLERCMASANTWITASGAVRK